MKVFTAFCSVGSVIDQDGNVYPMFKDGKPDLEAGVHIDDIEKDEEWYSSLSDKDKKAISQFESYINESIDIRSLIGTLVNSMDSYDERDFIKFFKELGGSSKLAKTVFNDYWKVDAMDRMDWDTPDWTEWLSQRGVK